MTKTLTGMWVKDKGLSDSMDPVCDLMRLGWLMRTATKVINKMEIKDEEDAFYVTLKAGGILDVKERFPWSGQTVEHSRRDKRRGKGRGHVERTTKGTIIKVEWDDPYAGTCSDHFVLSETGDQLEQITEMDVGGQQISYVSRFNRHQ